MKNVSFIKINITYSKMVNNPFEKTLIIDISQKIIVIFQNELSLDDVQESVPFIIDRASKSSKYKNILRHFYRQNI